MRPPGIRSLVVLLAFAMSAVPSASAARNDPAAVTGEIAIPGDFERLADNFFVLSGQMEVAGDTEGPLFVLDDEGSRFQVPLLRLYDMRDKVSLATERPVFEILNATLEPGSGADYVWAAVNITLEAGPGYSTAFLFDLLPRLDADLFEYTGQSAPFPPTLVATLEGASWQAAQRDTERSFYVPFGGSGFVIRDQAGNVVEPTSTDPEPQWLIAFYGTQAAEGSRRVDVTLSAKGVAVPVAEGVFLDFSRASANAFEQAFSVDRFATFIEDFLDLRSNVPDLPTPPTEDERDLATRCANESPPSEECRRYYEEHKGEAQGFPNGSTGLPVPLMADAEQPGDGEPTPDGQGPPEEGTGDQADSGETAGSIRDALGIFEDLGGFANGVLIGKLDGSMQYLGETYNKPGLTVMRFTELRLEVLPPDRLAMEGEAVLLYTQDSMPSDASGLRMGPLFLPFWSIALWIVAVGAILATKYWSLRDRDDALTHKLTIPAIATHVVLVVVGFLLFDIEMRHLFGTSLFTSMGILGFAGTPFVAATTVGTWTLASAEFGLWGIAWLFFGLPVKFIGRSVLLMLGLMRPSWHFAAGLAGIATWFFGATAILPLLGTALAAFL